MMCIQVRNLTKRFKNFTAIKNLSFDIREGEIFGLLGSNGAGKTTTLNILTGLLLPSEGEVRILGMDIKKDIERIRSEVSIVPQEIALYEELNVFENLKFFGKIYSKDGDSLYEKINELLDLFSLTDKKNKLVYQLSGGYQRRVSIAAALLANPKILFLDEPTSGIDLTTNQIIMDYIKNRRKNTTIVITTHSIKEAESICDTVLFLHEGKIILYGEPSNLINQYAQYFGERVIIGFRGEISDEEVRKVFYKYQKVIKNYYLGKDYLVFDIADTGEISLEIINILNKKDIQITNIDIQKPSLEDVFRYSIKQNDI